MVAGIFIIPSVERTELIGLAMKRASSCNYSHSTQVAAGISGMKTFALAA